MLLNFALKAVGTRVISNRISTDGYECSNLISSDFNDRNKGFLGEHFIKPPVDVTFSFPCNTNICCVLLDPFVGRQQSSQIEVFCASRPVPKTQHGLKFAKERSDSSFSQDESMPPFYLVSKILTSNYARICFHNPLFHLHKSCEFKHLMTGIDATAKNEMRHGRSELLMSATHLLIRISRTQSGSTPAMKKIEIWGCVSPQVNYEIRKSVHERYQASSQANADTAIFENKPSVSAQIKSENSKNIKGVQIPEEFVDPLTCEIMSVPMLLPSGKNVDKATLDRYFDSEASHGRRPRDPFTGVEFHGDAKPIPNGFLKSRIDHFLSQNSDDPSIGLLPRTLNSGTFRSSDRKRKYSTLQVSALVVNDETLPKISNSTDHLRDNKEDNTSQISFDTLTHIPVSNDSISVADNNGQYFNLSTTQRESQTLPTNASNSNLVTRTHESSLEDSLNNALFTLLGSSSLHNKNNSVKCSSSDSTSRLSTLFCFNCKKELTNEAVNYCLPCSHMLCRSCLLNFDNASNNGSIQCLICPLSYPRSEVIRAHSKFQ